MFKSQNVTLSSLFLISLLIFSCGGYTTEEIEAESKGTVIESISKSWHNEHGGVATSVTYDKLDLIFCQEFFFLLKLEFHFILHVILQRDSIALQLHCVLSQLMVKLD